VVKVGGRNTNTQCGFELPSQRIAVIWREFVFCLSTSRITAGFAFLRLVSLSGEASLIVADERVKREEVVVEKVSFRDGDH
jgi:hypothetical protein